MSGTKYTALVTGASAGIGDAFCRELAARCDVIIAVARREERLLQLRSELAGQVEVHAIAADLTTVEGVARSIEALRQLGPVDLLVNNAGMGVFGAFADAALEPQLATTRLHIDACLALTRAALPFMRERGSGAIINVASVGAFFHMKDTAVYGASKAFLQSFSESLQLEVASSGIRVQCLCPGMTRTEIHDTPLFEGFDKTRVPAELWMEPAEVVRQSLAALEEERVTVITGEQNVAMVSASVQATLDSLR